MLSAAAAMIPISMTEPIIIGINAIPFCDLGIDFMLNPTNGNVKHRIEAVNSA